MHDMKHHIVHVQGHFGFPFLTDVSTYIFNYTRHSVFCCFFLICCYLTLPVGALSTRLVCFSCRCLGANILLVCLPVTTPQLSFFFSHTCATSTGHMLRHCQYESWLMWAHKPWLSLQQIIMKLLIPAPQPRIENVNLGHSFISLGFSMLGKSLTQFFTDK